MTSDSVPLPSYPSTTRTGMGLVDGLLAVMLCVLAFLLASTPARNSDLLLHLASGRVFARGDATWGVDPFSSATKNRSYVNPTWLSDVLLFELHQFGDGKALVPAKALLAALLVGMLFLFRIPSFSVSYLFFIGIAAALALGPWLTLQPALLSPVCLLLTLYLLERPRSVEETAARARRQRWLIVPLFALWANLDGWFVLGPLTVGWYALGQLVRGSAANRWNEFFTLSLLSLAGLAACLCTPYHVRTLAWPTPLGLTPGERAWMLDPLGRDLVVSSFGRRFASSAIFTSPGAWAYYLLTIAGAISFFLAPGTLHWGRMLTWLSLAALSVYQARAIPFFAVPGAALMALNWQEFLRSRPQTESMRRLTRLARSLGLILGLVLAVLAWPGWLQPAPFRARGWDVEPDETMVRMARRLQREHDNDHLRTDRFALTFTPEAAHYLAWFCPAEKGFVDSRWPLFPHASADFARMRDLILQGATTGENELLSLLDAYHLDRILLYDPDRERAASAYRRLFLDEDHWQLAAMEGGAALFLRRTGSQPSPLVYDTRRLAYFPTDERGVSSSERPPAAPNWLDAFRLQGDDRSADREEAALHILSFDLQTEVAARRWVLTQATGLIGSGIGHNPAEAGVGLELRLDFGLPPTPRESLILAVRAARRALSSHPNDGQTFLVLGEAYLRLGRHTREAMWQMRLPRLAAIRQVQTLTALEQAVLLRPDLDDGHALLAQLYYESEQWDRVLDCLQARLRIVDNAVLRGGDGAASAAQRRSALRADVAQMEELVEKAQKTYKANSADISDPSKAFHRATLAARHRLTRQALDLLLASYPAIFGAAGVEMQLNLMLKAGRAYEVRAWLSPEDERSIGFSSFHWIEAQAAAACGDYATADTEMKKLSEVLHLVPLMPEKAAPVRSSIALRVGGAFLAHLLPTEGIAGCATALEIQSEAFRPLEPLSDLLRQEADWHVVRGLLALEWGEVETARGHFQTALDSWNSEEAAAAGSGVDFAARPIAQSVLAAIDEVRNDPSERREPH